MSLQTIIAADIAAILADAEGPAETVVYYPVTGASKTIRAIVERLSHDESSFTDGKSDQETAILHLSYAQVATLADGDYFGITRAGSSTEDAYKVLGIRADNGVIRELEIIRSVRSRLADELTERDRGRSASFSRST